MSSPHLVHPRAASLWLVLALALALSSREACAMQMKLGSDSIVEGRIQQVHACRRMGGEDQPLQLTLYGLPQDANYISIIVDDPDAVKPAGKVWVHWNVFNIPAHGDRVDIRAGQQLEGETGLNSAGQHGYAGMCPPDGTHTYRVAVFASHGKVQADTGQAWTIDHFERNYGDSYRAKAQIEGRFPG